MTPQEVLAFWLGSGPEKWFDGGEAFDAEVRAALLPAHAAAVAGALDDWAQTPLGALARIILLDQVPRNAFRSTPGAFASDGLALAAAEAAIAEGFDAAWQVPEALRTFFYLPFMHAEDPVAQARCLDLYRAIGHEEGVRYALVHKEAIDRFGRFPHRNPILGRAMSAEEQAWLDAGGFSG
ncbi:DUF924 family protein [Xanthobacter dioxanivorans]|uniref:DUF924 family protein n=1 Tax=Xanthobacter dioxanivorans TaxID=2528964 RepID=A0A974PR29_9HYPH|nr:DUF924 family protein [Xanthobacter dioxanivorans]QRG07819.1 DUF924 family protein [Xanthobacter dioxanivorans]